MTVAPRKLGWWSLSLILVFGLHAGLFAWALYWHPAPLPLVAPPAAVLIQLEPLVAQAKPAAPPPPQALPVEPEPQPELVEAPKPKLAIVKPKPKPKPRPQPPRPPEPKPPEPVTEAAPQEAPPSPPAKQQDQPAAPQLAAVSAPSKAEITWQSRLLSHLARYKRYPEDARRRGQEGKVTLRFVIDGKGRVLSHELVGRSGSASLDRATLQMIRRAQPLPAPPAELLKNGSLEVVAPFDYSLERH